MRINKAFIDGFLYVLAKYGYWVIIALPIAYAIGYSLR